MSIVHRKVQSSNIDSWGYDEAERALEVRFKQSAGRETHRYHDVPPHVAEGMTKAQSVGSYFAKVVRPFFKWAKVVAPKPETEEVPR